MVVCNNKLESIAGFMSILIYVYLFLILIYYGFSFILGNMGVFILDEMTI